MAFTDAIYSYFEYVRARVLALSTAQAYTVATGKKRVSGFMDAQDWPPKNINFESFYLLDLGATPVGKEFYSPTIPVIFRLVQWVWVNKGTDLIPGQRQANRGDRFVSMENMKGELINGSFPGFCQKQTWALDQNGNIQPTPSNTNEQIWWKPIEFHRRADRDSGLVYMIGSTRIVEMTDPILV